MGELRSTVHDQESNDQVANGKLKGGLLQPRALAGELMQITAEQQPAQAQVQSPEPENGAPSTEVVGDFGVEVPGITANPVNADRTIVDSGEMNDVRTDGELDTPVQEVLHEGVDVATQAEKELQFKEVEQSLGDCRDGFEAILKRDKLVVDALGGAIDKLRRIGARIPERGYQAQEDVRVLMRALSVAQESVGERLKVLQRQTRDKIGQEGVASRFRTAEKGEGDIPNKQYDEMNTLIADFEKAVNQAEEAGDNITRFTIRKIRGVMDSLRAGDPLIAIIDREIGDLEALLRAVSRGKTQEGFKEVKLSARRSKEALSELRAS